MESSRELDSMPLWRPAFPDSFREEREGEMAIEVGARVNVVAPGPVEIGMSTERGERPQ